MKYTLSILLFFSYWSIWSQSYTISGKLINNETREPVFAANVALFNQENDQLIGGVSSDLDGNFTLKDIEIGNYKLRASFIGYKIYSQNISITNQSINLGEIQMQTDAELLEKFEVEALLQRVVQKGDTTEMNADAFKTNPDATVEDLVKKMPGITVDGNGVTAQGEKVEKILIDGEEFFGDDALMALKNLPAEIVDKIQVFDRQSDQSRFSGVEDGETQKTINIVTKQGMSNGTFGKVYAGYGTDDRYSTGITLNSFQGKRRFSILGISNNINQQNFSTQDLVGALAEGGSSGGRGGRGGRRGGGSSPDDFLVGQQNGISTTHSLGINYSDKFGDKAKITASYLFNNSINRNNYELTREYFLSDINQFYDENKITQTNNNNHRLNFRLEWDIDSVNSIIFTPKLSLQNNNSINQTESFNYLSNVDFINQSLNDLSSNRIGYNSDNTFLYRHRFKKRGRTFSSQVRLNVRDRFSDNELLAQNTFFNPTDSMFVIDQIAESSNKSTTISANIVYTEPLGEKGKYGSIRINYTPSIVNSETEKVTNNFDDNTQSYSRLDSILSNSFLNNVMSQRVGFMYRMKYKKAGVSVGLDGEHAALRGSQTFPQNLNVNQTFENLLPFARLKFDFSKTKVLRMIYRTGTNIPNIDQLQNVVDNSNPLNIRAGNPDLTQEYQHGLTFRYNQTNADKGTVFFAFANASHETNVIGNSTLIAASDTLVDGIEILRGARYTRPQNIGNRQVITSLANYGFALTKLKSNINVNGGVNWVRSPGLINEVENFSNNTSFNSGVVVASNISEKVDFTLTYSASYHWVRNSIQTELNNNFLTQSTGAKINLLPYKGFVLSTDLVYRNFSGLGEGFNQSFALMNAGLGYKFLKNNAAEIRLTTFDLFNQNNSIARLVEDTYIEDRITQVLTRYYMLTFTYNNRKYKG